MPYIFVSTVALFSNLYRCAPLVVGDKDSDQELMDFLGAKYTTDYPGHKSPVYVLYATPRSLMDALQIKGFSMISTQTFEDYVTWTFSSPLTDDNKPSGQTSADSAVAVKTKSTPPSAAASPLPRTPPSTQKSPESVREEETPSLSSKEPSSVKYLDDSVNDKDLDKPVSSSSRTSRGSTRSGPGGRKKMDFKENPEQSAVARPRK